MVQSLTDKIVRKIKKNIKRGTWKVGEYMPPMRAIAEQEGVSRGIVTSAVSMLVGEGLLERVPRHGIRVINNVPDVSDESDNKKPSADGELEKMKGLAEQCIDMINQRRNKKDNSCRTEDLEAMRDCFSEIMDEQFNLARISKSSLISPEDAMLYDRGIRCAGWLPDRYTLFRCNLTTDEADLVRGNLLNFSFDAGDATFDDRTMDYLEKRVNPNDANDYLTLMNQKSIVEKSEDCEYTDSLEYREKICEDYRWLRVNLSASKDIRTGDTILYLLYQDIDAEKRNELLLKERTNEDALTSALNRRAFLLQSQQLLSESDESHQHAFLMLDVDGFKAVNDIFGHPVGDTVLSDLSKALQSVLRRGDLFGRIGGDEFVICLKDIPFDAVIEKKALQINELMRRDFDNGVSISGSIGIAVFPRDGNNYDELYAKMDMALYNAKESGKDKYVFYHDGMTRSDSDITISYQSNDEDGEESFGSTSKKKVLVVDDIESNRTLIAGMLKKDYTVLQAKDGRRAILTLRRYGTSISAVLLDLIMPGMNGFDVLSAMQREPILKSVPVIIVSGTDDNNDEFRAIEMGAMDFVKKPVDKRLLSLRLKNCVNKQENERLRIQNSYLQLQGDEEQRYRHIVHSTGTIVIEHDWVNGVFTYDKVISQYLTGTYDHRPLWRILLSDMVASSMDVKTMQNLIYELANSHKNTQTEAKIQLRVIGGEKHWFKMSAIKIEDSFSVANKILITLNDIDADVAVEERLRKLVEYDSLTDVYNRKSFLEKADEIIKASQSGKWLLSIIDINGFKVYNHLYGHDEGDKLLIYLAKQLSAAVARMGGVCGRIQADMFVALHPARRDFVDNLTEARNHALDSFIPGRKITSCTGRCYVDDITTPINTLLDRAMIAHHAAKNALEKDVCFSEGMQKAILREQKIISIMEQALSDKEFCVYFQPIIDYKTGRLVTAEALVRWIKPDGRIIPPNDFIPIFEQNGFIVKLDAYVWEKVCESIRNWLDAGIDVVPISVNVSRMDIYSGKLVDTVTGLIKKYDIPSSLLRLEITESAYMKNSEQIVAQVEILQKLGFIIEMDDFGSGFSSLNILSEVPVDILKLDMRFILGEDKNGRKSKIMGHIINMAISSNIDVIAEGVETVEQAEFLKSLGCSNMQGYYFSKPVPTPDFLKFIKHV